MSLPHSNRMTNTTCHHEWLDMFKEDASIIDVISLTDPPKPFDFKGVCSFILKSVLKFSYLKYRI